MDSHNRDLFTLAGLVNNRTLFTLAGLIDGYNRALFTLAGLIDSYNRALFTIAGLMDSDNRILSNKILNKNHRKYLKIYKWLSDSDLLHYLLLLGKDISITNVNVNVTNVNLATI